MAIGFALGPRSIAVMKIKAFTHMVCGDHCQS